MNAARDIQTASSDAARERRPVDEHTGWYRCIAIVLGGEKVFLALRKRMHV